MADYNTSESIKSILHYVKFSEIVNVSYYFHNSIIVIERL